MVRAGHAYWRQGRVADLEIDTELDVITAKVSGSARRPYDVTVIFGEDNPDYPVEADCSCPVGFGCKHGAAVLYAARMALPQDAKSVAMPRLPPPARDAPLPQPLFLWLADAHSHAPARQADAPEMAYVIAPRNLHPVKKTKGQPSPAAMLPMPFELTVRVWFNQPTPDGHRLWREPNRYDRTWTAQAPTPVDAWLVKRLADYHGDVSGGTPRGIAGADWIEQAIVTGRTRWRKPDGPVLHAGEGRVAAFRWVTVAGGEQRLTLADVPPGMTLVALAPPLLIDGETGAVHPVSTGVESTLAERLLHLPPVPLHAVQTLSEQWNRVAGGAVPPPALHNLIDRGMIAPVPVLTFREV